jgi:hypothetical protein
LYGDIDSLISSADSTARLAMRTFLPIYLAAILAPGGAPAWAGADDATAFFESRIRPVLGLGTSTPSE